MIKLIFVLSVFCVCATGQRVTTIQLDNVQYYISRMNPYSPELNYFLAYQYCRSLGLQLASFETKEKHDSITNYLASSGYHAYDFWTSGNNLGTKMFLWMSTGIPFNATFDYFDHSHDESPVDNLNTAPQRTARDDRNKGQENRCVILKAPNFNWKSEDCSLVKDFICEQTRCYYYNYGSIPVSSSPQGRSRVTAFSTRIVSTTTPYPLEHKEASSLYHSLSSTNAPAVEEKVEVENDIDSNEDPTDASTEAANYEDEENNATEEEEHDANTEAHNEQATETLEDHHHEADEEEHEDAPEEEAHEEEEEIPVEQKLKQISEEIEKYSNNEQAETSDDRQSFFSLSDLIKTLQPAVKKAPQIDSDYSNTMKVLGEQTSYTSVSGVRQTNRSL